MTTEKSDQENQPGKDENALAGIEKLFGELKLSDEGKKVMMDLFGGVATQMQQLNERVSNVESNGAGAAMDPGVLDGLTPDQKYNILMAKASAPAAAAQAQMWQGLVSGGLGGGSKGAGGGAGGLDQILSSAKTLEALRSILVPPPSALQIAMERAQVAQMVSQSRLMNRVAGKKTDDYLDNIEKIIGAELPGDQSSE
ncbi:hypothetical protein ES703_72176 [subsurface metagenome]